MTSTAVIKRDKSPPADYEIRAHDLMTGIPKEVKVRYSEIACCLYKSMAKIEEAMMKVLEEAPPELSLIFLPMAFT